MSAFIKGLRQIPAPGTSHVRHKGDTLEFTLILPEPRHGKAWLRTNLGHASVHRREIIEFVERGRPILEQDWHDVPMRRADDLSFTLTIPLLEVGYFQAKALFMARGDDEPVWPEDRNVAIKVEPAEYCCANTIYAAFVRQFGSNKQRAGATADHHRATDLLERDGYAVIPRSGTFRDLIRELDFIIGALRFRILQLLPIHPTPTTYARMGRYGSPFAALDFKDVDPALAEFDRQATPLEQFGELVDATHRRGARLFLDIPVNHTGWASRMQDERPDWFTRGQNRMFESPSAWGVTWEDLSKLDYGHRPLWEYMAGVFRFWCRHGVDGFRCDAGHMVPLPVWEYVTAKVREEHPDTIFLLEGLGGKLDVVERMLSDGGLNWAYSELFQNYDRASIEAYLSDCLRTASTCGALVHFAETHDNNRLAARSQAWARLRTALCALCSFDGAFGISNGVEWFADEKIDVHDARSLKWGNPENQIDQIARLNAILEVHPAFHSGARPRIVHREADHAIAVRRDAGLRHPPVLVLANLDDDRPGSVSWNRSDFVPDETPFHDLLTGRKVEIERGHGHDSIRLAPGEVLALTARRHDLQDVAGALETAMALPEGNRRQLLRAKAQEIQARFRGLADVSRLDPDREAARLAQDPRAYCADAATRGTGAASCGESAFAPVTIWEWPQDARRRVMMPPGHFLLVRAARPFSAELLEGDRVLRRETALRQDDGSWFALFLPLPEPDLPRALTLAPTVHGETSSERVEAPVLGLPRADRASVRRVFAHYEIDEQNSYALATNGRGGMAQVRGNWGEILSQYDAILAANLHPEFPVDRQVMFTRCRAWVVFQGYSCELNKTCLKTFLPDEAGGVVWRFRAPVGRGKVVPLDIRLDMPEGRNAVTLEFLRRRSPDDEEHLDNGAAARLILRPDVEDRCNHHKTKAYTGPERTFPLAVSLLPGGFRFAPSADHCLDMKVGRGSFTQEHEWRYMVPHPFERERGLDDCSDLFSPGYFVVPLKGGERTVLTAAVAEPVGPARAAAARRKSAGGPEREVLRLDEAMRRALGRYIVKRESCKTVIAGYPWFLDWGRDTLIALRGIVAAGMIEEARDILRQFARFETRGTLPNMIRGGDASNRDTTDAPLWFFTACADLARAQGKLEFLNLDCGGRTVKSALRSIAEGVIRGAPNGVRMDSESGLVFSPSHFTWMDTNYPAGAPREGYPIEIQALWHAALRFLAEIEPRGRWKSLAELARDSVTRLYPVPYSDGPAKEKGGRREPWKHLSDCLRARPGQSAREAIADDALRPNQLLAITLGLVTNSSLRAGILGACEELLVPGAIRSLADRPVTRALPILIGDRLLNDPHHPYWGQYRGDENTKRKPAYHNGTAWTWLFPSYAEALVMTYGEQARETARAMLGSTVDVINRGCLGHVPEIVDGDAPHALRGCGAQAWGASELLRVLLLLEDRPKSGK
ncbi:MAG: amylo-alpha-1,6-glucosidase [Verrucomicrobiota bacterium]|nr:amylo-alpha-1,6-glucosidase [Verrucomicrobiota bacterium]